MKLKSIEKGKKGLFRLLINIRKILVAYWKMRPGFVLLYVGVMLGIAILPFGVSFVNGQLINKVVDFLAGKDVSRILIYQFLVIALVGGMLERIFYKVADFVDRMSYYDWNGKVPIDIARIVSGLDMAKLEDADFRTKLARVEDGSSHRAGSFVSRVFWMINDLTQVVVAMVILSRLAVWVMPVVFVTLLPEFWVSLTGSKSNWGIWNAKEAVKKRYWEVQNRLSEENSIQEVRIFGLRSYLLNMMNDLLSEFLGEERRVFRRENKLSSISSFFENLAYGVVEFWVLLQVLARKLGVGDYNFYLASINRFVSASRNLLRNISRLYEDNLYLSDYFELMEIKNEIVLEKSGVKVKSDRPPRIEFKNVSFGYPGSRKKVFNDFNMIIESGADVALVGENGVGKTTLVKLLSRFYDVDDGEILIDGVNIKDIDLNSWYKNMGVLFQRFNLYQMTAYENIVLGDVTKLKDKDGVIKAAKLAGAHEIIEKLKNKYEHILSKWFSGGTDLSYGQWQRVALARAFFRGANVLILDEPTSAIDAKGEYEIFNKLTKYQKGKTTIIISHRFSTVRKADKIYVMKKGKIVEQGKHEELLKNDDGLYKKMFELQAEGYK